MLEVKEGVIATEGITVLHAQSFAEDVFVYSGDQVYSGMLPVASGRLDLGHETISTANISLHGRSLIHSAALTTEAFKRSILGDFGQYIVAIGLLLFAFSTAISWSYYGGRAVTYLFGTRYVIVYRMFYVVAFFLASFTDTTIVWNLSYITIALMTIPNLAGILILQKDIKSTIRQYWKDFRNDWPGERVPPGS
jgi:AGCS family alanine or glycine:cation symporter